MLDRKILIQCVMESKPASAEISLEAVERIVNAIPDRILEAIDSDSLGWFCDVLIVRVAFEAAFGPL